MFLKQIKNNKPNMIRLVVEVSAMNNNMEVSYTFHESKLKNVIETAKEMGFCIRLQRPIHKDEPDYPNPFEIYKNENLVAPLTKQLDDIYKVLNGLNFWVNDMKLTPTEALQRYIEIFYYDCMSGGMGKMETEICSILIDDKRIDKNQKFFMDNSTLGDFANEFRPKEISETIKLLEI